MITIAEMISRRKSFRGYTPCAVDVQTLDKIHAFVASARPLYPDIRVHFKFVSKSDVTCILPWVPPQLIAIYTEEKDGARENVGFLFQQVDLYLQSIGLGSCWIGMGKPDKKQSDGLQFVMLLAFGYPKEPVWRDDVTQFKRKPLAEISDRTDERLEPARIAPSAVNSQPWYFIHDGEAIHACRSKQGLLAARLDKMNRIDMGISLAHVYAANPDTFRFFLSDAPQIPKGHVYTGSFYI